MLVQVVEQLPLNQRVVGSSPTAPTNNVVRPVYDPETWVTEYT